MFEKRVNLFGLLIDDISLSRAIEIARVSFISSGQRVFFTPNLEMLEGARKSDETNKILNSASVLLPDGAGVLLASRFVGTPIKNKVAGIDFGEELISLCEKGEKSIFLLGASHQVVKKAAKKLIKKHPKLKICGIHNGYFKKDEEATVISKIQRANPDVLLVCMGFPKQERFVYEHKNELSGVKVIACLGGALDIWSGRKRRAPDIIKKVHLEWLWRILSEPRRVPRFVSSLPVLFYAVWNEEKF